MTQVEDILKREGMDEKEIHIYRYFRPKWFTKRVRRYGLPPSRLYWRVRAVFEVFGSKVDPETNKILFNKTAWTKARTILKEITMGYYSDPKDDVIYRHVIKSTGEAKYDRYGIALLRCDRDTNSL